MTNVEDELAKLDQRIVASQARITAHVARTKRDLASGWPMDERLLKVMQKAHDLMLERRRRLVAGPG